MQQCKSIGEKIVIFGGGIGYKNILKPVMPRENRSLRMCTRQKQSSTCFPNQKDDPYTASDPISFSLK